MSVARPLTLPEQIVANCVGLLLTPEAHMTADWRALLVDTLHAQIPACDTTHVHMAPLLRHVPLAWPKGVSMAMHPAAAFRAREAWVALQTWRLGEAVDALGRGKAA